MKLIMNSYSKILLNIFISIIVIIINSGCGNKNKNNGYKKIKGKDFVKIDYSKYVEKPSNSEINIAFTEFPHTLNPYRAGIKSEFFLKKALFSSLFYLDPETGLPEKNLIERFNISNNGLEYYFTLRDNIKFNNGINLNTEDVIYSLELLKTVLKDSDFYKDFFILNQELIIEFISYNKFKISLDVPNGNLLYALSNFPIIPKGAAEIISDDIETFINYWEIKSDMNIIGSGPYIVDEITDEKITLTYNKYYFKKDKKENDLPYTKTINIKFYNNKNNEILGFLNNDTDIVSINLDDYNMLNKYFKKNNILKIRFIDTGFSKNRVLVAYNCFRENSKSYLKNNEFRKYLSFFIKKALDNKEADLGNYSVDKDFFKDSNHDGILEYKDGNTIFIRILAMEEEKEIINIVKKIKDVFEKLNFEVYLEIVPLHLFLEKMFINFDYDIGIFYYNFDPGIISYYQLLDKDVLSFYPYVYDNNISSERIIKKMKDCIYTFSNKNQIEEIKKLQNILSEINQLFPIYIQNKYYLSKSTIYNLKINSSFEEGYNLRTIETLVNSSLP